MDNVISRRGFFTSGAALATAFGFDLRPAQAAVRELKISRTTQTNSVCSYCAVGCPVIIHTLGDKSKNVKPAVVHIKGDPDSPVNRGTLCAGYTGVRRANPSKQPMEQVGIDSSFPAPGVGCRILAVKAASKPGLNDACWCGSTKEFKRCHLDRHAQKALADYEIDKQMDQIRTRECCL